MSRITEEDVRRILEDSDGEDMIMEGLDQEDHDDDDDRVEYLEVGEEIEESVEAIARELLSENESSMSTVSGVRDSTFHRSIHVPNEPSQAPRLRRPSNAPAHPESEWSFEVKQRECKSCYSANFLGKPLL